MHTSASKPTTESCSLSTGSIFSRVLGIYEATLADILDPIDHLFR